MSVPSMSVVDKIPKAIPDNEACAVCLTQVGDLRIDSGVKYVVEKTGAGSRIACLDCVKVWFTSEQFIQNPSRKSPITQCEMSARDFEVIGCPDVTAGIHGGNTGELINRLKERFYDVADEKEDAIQDLVEARRRAPFGGLFSSFKGLEKEIKDLDAELHNLANRIKRFEKYKGISTRSILKSSMYSIATTVCSIGTLGLLGYWVSHNPRDESQPPTPAENAVGLGMLTSLVGSIGGLVTINEPITEVLERWESS